DVRKHQQHAPMWVIPIADVLTMVGPPPSHQKLMEQGRLVECKLDFLVIFVSHQWLGLRHPDSAGEQLRVLQDALRNITSGNLQVENDVMSQMTLKFRKLSPAERDRLAHAYIWMDWFCVPQISQVESMHSDAGLVSTAQDAYNCIRSIPFYVDTCEIFVALVPKALHNNLGCECSYRTWLRRGWCRTEMWCKLLSEKSTIPIVVISGGEKAEFISPVRWVHYPVHQGDFTVEADRCSCNEIVRTALDFKLAGLRNDPKKIDLYRYYMSRYEDFCGQPTRGRTLGEFLSRYKFPNLLAAIRQKKGMGAVACAVGSGDTEMITNMVQAGAPIDTRFPDMPEVDLWAGFTPLFLAAMRSFICEDTLLHLLREKADPNATCAIGTVALGTCYTASAVSLMVAQRADVNICLPPSKCSPLSTLTGRGAQPKAVATLIALRGDVNNRGCTPLTTLAFMYQGHMHALETAQVLLDAKADVNLAPTNSALFNVLEGLARAYTTVAKEPPFLVKFFSNASSTPLGYASLCGNVEYVDFLLQARADTQKRNKRGQTPIDLAKSENVSRSFDLLGHHPVHQLFDVNSLTAELLEERF
ncbi:ANKRD50, partial [Symbiodinium natans]